MNLGSLAVLVGMVGAVSAAECQHRPVPPAPPVSSGGAEPTSGGATSGGAAVSGGSGGQSPVTACERSCDRLRELKCPTALPSHGESCEAVCENLNASETLRLDTECVVRATSCNQADRCVR